MTAAPSAGTTTAGDQERVLLEREIGELAARCAAMRGELADRDIALAAAHAVLGEAVEAAGARHVAEIAALRRALEAAEHSERHARQRAEAAEGALARVVNSKVMRWSRMPRRVYGKVARAWRGD